MPFFSLIKLWKRWLHQPLTRALAHESSVDPRMSPYGRQWAQISKALGFEEKEAAADLPLDVDSLVARAAGLSLRLTFVSFIAFHSRIAKCPGHFWVQEMALFWGRVTWFSIAGFCFGGVQTEARFFCKWVDWCAQQAQLQGHELLWLNMDETCVQRGMPTASGAVVGPTVLHIVYLLGLAATWGHCP